MYKKLCGQDLIKNNEKKSEQKKKHKLNYQKGTIKL